MPAGPGPGQPGRERGGGAALLGPVPRRAAAVVQGARHPHRLHRQLTCRPHDARANRVRGALNDETLKRVLFACCGNKSTKRHLLCPNPFDFVSRSSQSATEGILSILRRLLRFGFEQKKGTWSRAGQRLHSCLRCVRLLKPLVAFHQLQSFTVFHKFRGWHLTRRAQLHAGARLDQQRC